jgi:hypothetical protein
MASAAENATHNPLDAVIVALPRKNASLVEQFEKFDSIDLPILVETLENRQVFKQLPVRVGPQRPDKKETGGQ